MLKLHRPLKAMQKWSVACLSLYDLVEYCSFARLTKEDNYLTSRMVGGVCEMGLLALNSTLLLFSVSSTLTTSAVVCTCPETLWPPISSPTLADLLAASKAHVEFTKHHPRGLLEIQSWTGLSKGN